MDGARAMKRLLKGIDTISEWSGKLSSWVIYIGIAVLVYEVVVRYVFNAATSWAHGLSERVFVAYFLLSGGLITLQRAHISMDLFYSRFSVRGKAICDVLGMLFLIAFSAVLLWKGWGYAWQSIRVREVDLTTWHAPIYPVKVLIPLGGSLILLQGLANLSRHLTTAITGRKHES